MLQIVRSLVTRANLVHDEAATIARASFEVRYSSVCSTTFAVRIERRAGQREIPVGFNGVAKTAQVTLEARARKIDHDLSTIEPSGRHGLGLLNDQ